MRDSWESKPGNELDQPAAITERQLRSLKRGARAGRLAIFLSLISTVAALAALLVGPSALAGSETVQGVREKLLSVVGHQAPDEERSASPGSPTTPGGPGAADSASTGPPPVNSGNPERSTR